VALARAACRPPSVAWRRPAGLATDEPGTEGNPAVRFARRSLTRGCPQSGKSIPAGQAAQLIADAQRIQAVLAC
jgi:hypothetical protein